MISPVILHTLLWLTCFAEEYYYHPYNVSRSTVSGLVVYRSALTLDWLATEDKRQRELVKVFETESSLPQNILGSDCMSYARPASGKIARLMLEMLKSLEGDNCTIIPNLVQSLAQAQILVETSMLDAEPDLEALIKTPDVMMGQPHVTLPRILAMVWIIITDPTTTRKYGWCPVTKITKYVNSAKSNNIALHLHALESIVGRTRFMMDEFIQHVTPIIYEKTTIGKNKEEHFKEKLHRSRQSKTVKSFSQEPFSKNRMEPVAMSKIIRTAPDPEELQDPTVNIVSKNASHTQMSIIKNTFILLCIIILQFCFVIKI